MVLSNSRPNLSLYKSALIMIIKNMEERKKIREENTSFEE
jgi:hypothetical protein